MYVMYIIHNYIMIITKLKILVIVHYNIHKIFLMESILWCFKIRR